MINQSRLQPISKVQTARTNQDEFKALNSLDGSTKADAPTTLFDVLAPSANAPGLPSGNSFSQLLEMSKIEKPVADDKTERQSVATEKPQKETKKEAKSDDNNPRKSTKSKDKKNAINDDNEQALSQLLGQQNTFKPTEQLVAVQVAAQPQVQKDIQGPAQAQAKLDQGTLGKTPSSTAALAANDDAAAPQSLNDVMKTLDNKLERLTSLEKNGHMLQSSDKMNQLNELASKFDDVKFEFTPEATASAVQSGNSTVDVNKELQARELMRKLSEQEWAKNDVALRDLVAQQSANELAIEKLGLDRLDQMNQLKNAQLDRMQQQDLLSQAALKDVQAREFQASSQPQWLSYHDLPVEQRAMIDAVAKGQAGQTMGYQMNSNPLTSDGQQNLTNRLNETSGKPQLDTASAQNTVGGLQSLAGMGAEQNNGAAGKQNSNSSSFSQRNDSTTVGSVGVNAQDVNKARFDDAQVNEKADARGKEAERAREMARAAALRTQSIASELAIRGGGTAKVQIKDSQLGVVELRINMSDNNKVSVELIANSDRIKNELQKQSEELKSGLEKHNVVLEGVHFATDVKLGDTSAQNQSQSDNSRANQQQQQQQSMSSFSQGNGNSSNQQNFSGGERFFEAPRTNLNNPAANNGNVRKIYSGKNEAQTNVQRTANGSLKVIA